jgi:hypothetical protein
MNWIWCTSSKIKWNDFPASIQGLGYVYKRRYTLKLPEPGIVILF